eukprot:TRINITY_DN6969_c0_g1_i1.p1 TRINITY_DN6969_c0_g1~~TRINITY_DN6969_c0_g1_i1.p1  ORF type:complete len:539 (-),score=88.79 TRINITY_DN6969_c0_g1_i1:97-1713(-)
MSTLLTRSCMQSVELQTIRRTSAVAGVRRKSVAGVEPRYPASSSHPTTSALQAAQEATSRNSSKWGAHFLGTALSPRSTNSSGNDEGFTPSFQPCFSGTSSPEFDVCDPAAAATRSSDGNGNDLDLCSVESSSEGRLPEKAAVTGVSNGAFRLAKTLQLDVEPVLKEDEQTARPYSKIDTFGAVWRFLEDDTSSTLAWIYSRSIPLLITFSVCCASIQVLVPSADAVQSGVLNWIELAVEVSFLTEVLARFISSPHRVFFCSGMFNLIDMASIAPLCVRIAELSGSFVFAANDFVSFNAAVAVLRLLKLLRRFDTFHLLVSAFAVSFEVLPVLLFILFVIALVFSAIFFSFEARDNVADFQEAFWLTIVTISTVGFGDISPKTPAGRTACIVLIIISVLYMAIPIGIVGTSFSRVWEDRHRLLLMQRIRAYVRKAGYRIADIEEMFRRIDKNNDNELDFNEFHDLMALMQIPVPLAVVAQVFETFDEDGEGSIDFREFIKGLFPSTHRLMERRHAYDAARRKSRRDLMSGLRRSISSG